MGHAQFIALCGQHLKSLSMQAGKLTFKPALVPSLLTLLLLPVLLSLGFWQLRRAHEKEVLQASFQASLEAPYVPVATVDLAAPAALYRKVIAPGHYDSSHQILLDNQFQGEQLGYQVFTPLRLAGQAGAILVDRGWVPLGVSRQQVPAVTVTNAEVTIKGRVSQPANPGLRLAEPANAVHSWPRVVQYVDYQQLSAELGYPLAPAVILLDPEAGSGYQRDWHPSFGGFGPERHQAYAVQWFALAVALVIIYIVVNTQRRPEDT
jgi:surfeit locus 1 family protein